MGLGSESCNTLKLDIEEYLIGLTHLSNELVIIKLLDSYQVILISNPNFYFSHVCQ